MYSLFRISSLWRLRREATMEMMDGGRRTGDSPRRSYKVKLWEISGGLLFIMERGKPHSSVVGN